MGLFFREKASLRSSAPKRPFPNVDEPVYVSQLPNSAISGSVSDSSDDAFEKEDDPTATATTSVSGNESSFTNRSTAQLPVRPVSPAFSTTSEDSEIDWYGIATDYERFVGRKYGTSGETTSRPVSPVSTTSSENDFYAVHTFRLFSTLAEEDSESSPSLQNSVYTISEEAESPKPEMTVSTNIVRPDDFCLSNGNLNSLDTSVFGVPSYALEFLKLCNDSDLLVRENAGFEKRFSATFKAYGYLSDILKRSRGRLPVKFESHDHYLSFFLPYLFLDAAAEISSNLSSERPDNYEACVTNVEWFNEENLELTISYWIPVKDIDGLEDTSPSSIKNLRNSLLFISEESLPVSYDKVPGKPGVLGLPYSPTSRDNDYRNFIRDYDLDKRLKTRTRESLDTSGQAILKPSAWKSKETMYHEIRTKIIVPNNDKSQAIQTGSRVYLSVLTTLTQTMKQLETLLEMEFNPLFRDYFLSPHPRAFELPVERDYIEGLNRKQSRAVNCATQLAEAQEPKVLMIQGPPGTGKTHTIVSIVRRHVEEWSQPSVLICAPSNIAIDVIGRRLDQEGFDILRIGRLEKTAEGLKDRHIKIMRDPKTEEDLFLTSPIILSTLNSSQPMYRGNRKFSLVIVDEAAQCAEPEVIMPLIYRPRTLILVGDPKQLPPTVISWDAEKAGYSQSLFERLQSIAGETNMIVLTEQYRMKPEICEMPSEIFYSGILTSLPENGLNPLVQLPALACFDVTDSVEQSKLGSKFNLIEMDVIIEILKSILSRAPKVPLVVEYGPEDEEEEKFCFKRKIFGRNAAKRRYLRKVKIGIICFYAEQVRVLEKEINEQFWFCKDLIDVKTVDSFQGQERDIIIVSCCRSNADKDIGFLKLPNRVNVAVTRAKSSLIVVCNKSTLDGHKIWDQMFQHFRSRIHTVQSTVRQTELNRILSVQ